MSCDFNTESSGWDRTCLDLSSKMAEPLCQAYRYLYFRMASPLDPAKFENRNSVVSEIALRAILGTGSLLALFTFPSALIGSALFLAVGSKLLRSAGYFFQKNDYTHIRGNAAEKILDPQAPEVKMLSWNHFGIGGGMSLDHGGVVDWRYRLESLAAKIEKEDPDVLVLMEQYDAAFTEALFERLKESYAHFFTHLGPNLIGSESGVLILSKCAVHNFSYTAFENNHWTLNRGFASLEIKASPQDEKPFCRVIGTHLHHGDQPKDLARRMPQVAQIVDTLVTKPKMPTLIAGDLNIERDGEEGKPLIPLLRHGYLGNEPTCTNHLVAQWDHQTRGTWEKRSTTSLSLKTAHQKRSN
jgi:endonuclease/exonuclease/phosphatase family metal-dependent hydrolase